MRDGQSLVQNGEVILSGYVVADGDAAWLGDGVGYFCPQMVRDALSQVVGAAVVRLSSEGGDPFAGEAIRSTLAQHPGGVEVIVEGIAASAASLLFMGGTRRLMSAGSMLMIHDPSTMVFGTEAELLQQAAVMGQLADTYAAVYARAAGNTTAEARRIMKAETWFNAEEAIAAGFADDILAEGDASAAPSAMTLDAAMASFSRMTQGMVAMTARKKSGASPDARDPSAAAGGATALMAISEEAAMPEQVPAAVPAATIPVLSPVTPPVVMAAPPRPEDIVLAERTRQREIRAMSSAFITSGALVQADIDALIDDGTSAADAGQRFMTRMAATQAPVSRGAATIAITRDEGDTRRTGVEMALYAQLSRKPPESDVAKPYMAMSMVEMATQINGYKGALRTPGDRINAFMAGVHTTSDYTGIFENALNKVLLDRYQVHQPTYRKIARKKVFNDFRVHPMVRAGDFPSLMPIGEGGEVKFGTFGEKRETAVLSSYGVGLRISRQAMINDEMGAIADLVADYGQRVLDFEEATFYSFMSTATLSSDGLAVWLAAATRGFTAAGNLTSAGTAITIASLGIGQAIMRKQVSIESKAGAADGQKLNLTPKILLVGPDKEVEAKQLVTSITPALAGSVNPFAGNLEPVVSAQVSGNNWYLFADPNMPGGQCFVYGYLNGSESPRLRTDEPFGVQGWAMTLTHDFGLGAMDFRGTYKNNGA